jgi:hypothetical protein
MTIDYFLCVPGMNSGQSSELLDGSGVDVDGFDHGRHRNPNHIRRHGLLIAFRTTARGQACAEKSCSYKKTQAFNLDHLA